MVPQLGSKNPEHDNVEISVNKKKKLLGSINPENAGYEISVSKKVNCLRSKNPNQNKKYWN